MSVEANDPRKAHIVLPACVFAKGRNQSQPDPGGVGLGDGRILIPCFD